MNWRRLGKLLFIGVITFTVIVLSGLLFIRLSAPSITSARMAALNTMMLAVSTAIIAVLVWATSGE